MKVLYIVSSFPRNEKDTYVRWLLENVKRLSEKNVEITVLAPSYKGLKNHNFGNIKVKRFRYFFKKWEDLTHEGGMAVKLKNPFYTLVFLFYFISGFLNTIKICKKEKFDIIHVHWPFPHALWAYKAAKINNSKVVLTFYAVELLMIKKKFKFLKKTLLSIINKADKIITFSSYIQELLRELSRKEVTLIPYGITIKEKKYKKVNNKTKRILFVGRLVERKGLDYLIEAMPMMLKEINCKLIIIGDGVEERKLRILVKKYNLNKNVEFLGKVSDGRLENEYKNCDAFVLPAIIDSKGETEGLGVVLIEALCYKKPVIASNVGGIPDVIIDGTTGLLVQEKNTKELSKIIVKVLKNKRFSEKLGNQGYKYVKKKFDWNKIVDDMYLIYKKVV